MKVDAKHDLSESAYRKFGHCFVENWNRSDLGTEASNLSYTAVLSLVPFVAVFFSFAKFFGQLYGWSETIKRFILRYATQGTADDFAHSLDAAVGRLGFENVGWFGFIGTLVTAMIMLNTINVTVQKVVGVSELRSWTKRVFIYFLVVLLGPIGCALLLAMATSADSVVGSFLPSWSVAIVYLCALLFVVYKFVPNRPFRTWWTLASAAVTSLALLILQTGFLWAVKNLFYYNQVYGSLASVPIFLLWLYLVWYTVLLGAVLSATLSPGRAAAEGSTVDR